MMGEIFRHFVEVSIVAGYLIAAVLLVRLCLKKASYSFKCMLWFLVAVRLMIPVNIEVSFSLVPEIDLQSQTLPQLPKEEIEAPIKSGEPDWGKEIEESQAVATDTYADTVENAPGEGVLNEIPKDEQGMNGASDYPKDTSFYEEENVNLPDLYDVQEQERDIFSIAGSVWIAGVILMLSYMLVSWLQLKYSLREAVPESVGRLGRQVKFYRHESVTSPFLFGVIVPKIYVPTRLSGEELHYVLAHEQTHLSRKDHLWKPLAYFIVALYWFHPLVWVAYILFGRDIELACDERVLKREPGLERTAYAQALLACSSGRKRVAVCPMAFGESDVKKRVKNVLHYKKPGFWIMAGCVVVSILVVLCFMTVSGKEDAQTDKEDFAILEKEADEKQDIVPTEDSEEEMKDDNQQVKEMPTKERIVKYRMYSDVIAGYTDGETKSFWESIAGEFVYERSDWYKEYQGGQIQRVEGKTDVYSPATCPDVIYYKAEEGEQPQDVVFKMLDALVKPMTEASAERSYTITQYTFRNQQTIQVGDGIWLLPYIDGYYEYEGLDLISLEAYRESDGAFEWNGLMPFMRQGSESVFYYILLEEDSVYRLQRAVDMVQMIEESDKGKENGNKQVFYYPVNSVNAPGYGDMKENEVLAPDCFFVDGERIFIDDTVNDRILVYRKGAFEKQIGLDPNRDVKLMHYNPQTDMLTVVYSDSRIAAPNYYLTDIKVSSGVIMDDGLWEEEIEGSSNVLTHFCFDSAGVLLKDYEESLTGSGDFPYKNAENTVNSWKIIARTREDVYKIHSAIENVNESTVSLSCIMKNNTAIATPVADLNAGDRNLICMGSDGKLYQMIADETGVRIFRLAFRSFWDEDRDDMLAMQIGEAQVHCRENERVAMQSIERFEMLTMEQLLEWTNGGKFAEMVQEKEMELFWGYENLTPPVIHMNTNASTYKCELAYGEEKYILQIFTLLPTMGNDTYKIYTITVLHPETMEYIMIYAADSQEKLVDLQKFLDGECGMEEYISYTLPTGFTMGKYGNNFMSGLLIGDVEEILHGKDASESIYYPGGIDILTSSDYLREKMVFENGKLAKVIWRENHRSQSQLCEPVEGCTMSAVLTEFSFDLFTYPEAYEYIEQHPEVTLEEIVSSRYWYVFICDEDSELVYVAYMNQKYFTKDDMISFARSIRPTGNF